MEGNRTRNWHRAEQIHKEPGGHTAQPFRDEIHPMSSRRGNEKRQGRAGRGAIGRQGRASLPGKGEPDPGPAARWRGSQSARQGIAGRYFGRGDAARNWGRAKGGRRDETRRRWGRARAEITALPPGFGGQLRRGPGGLWLAMARVDKRGEGRLVISGPRNGVGLPRCCRSPWYA
jgi:hypothetical protein